VNIVEVLLALVIVVVALLPLLTAQSSEVHSLRLVRRELFVGGMADDLLEMVADGPNDPLVAAMLSEAEGRLVLTPPPGATPRQLRYPHLLSGVLEPEFERTWNEAWQRYDPKLSAHIERDVGGTPGLCRATVTVDYRDDDGRRRVERATRLFFGVVTVGPSGGTCVPFSLVP